MYDSVNLRELKMLREVLPKLQDFLDEKCEGFFRLPMPNALHIRYEKDEDSADSDSENVFVMENLLEAGYYNYTDSNCLDEDHLKAVLDGLAYLHGTGLAYKHAVTPEGGKVEKEGRKQMLEDFPGLEEQIQLSDLFARDPAQADSAWRMRSRFRAHFRAYLHFMSAVHPALARQVAFVARMHRHVLAVVENLEECGYERLVTLAHGDAKPNNFLFRKIEIDLEELECEGIESILVDWQGGFLGSVANDLMWAVYPFVERDSKGLGSAKAFTYYHEQLGHVLESFGLGFKDLGLPSEYPAFSSLLRKCLVLEFLIVTIVKPILAMDEAAAAKLLKWHKETCKNKRRRFKKPEVMPEYSEVFSSPRFTAFCALYFSIANALGAFQELGQIYFDVMKENMFAVDKLEDGDSDEEDDTDLVSRVINAKTETLVRVTSGIVLGLSLAIGLYLAWANNVHTRLYEFVK